MEEENTEEVMPYAESRRLVAVVAIAYTNMIGEGLAGIANQIVRNLRSEDGQAVDLADKGEALGEAINAFSRAAFAMIEHDPKMTVKQIHLNEDGVPMSPEVFGDAMDRILRDIAGTGSDPEQCPVCGQHYCDHTKE